MRPAGRFRPEEVSFCPTAACNLRCPHCTAAKSKERLSLGPSLKFLSGCRSIGVTRVGFSGGEPFLAPDFLCAVTKEALRHGMTFNRIMTNAVWFKDGRRLSAVLSKLRENGYDGSICVSVDAFHRQDIRKVCSFMREARAVWGRPDVVSITRVSGALDEATDAKLKSLAGLLGGRLIGAAGRQAAIKTRSLFIRIFTIELSPIGRAERLKKPWDGKWFKEDFCKGPGNMLFVQPSGDVRPCCGYAADSEFLTVGNIKDDSCPTIMKNIRKNNFVSAIYSVGLSGIRRTLARLGVNFPGRTTNHCYFCSHILTRVPRNVLEKCLEMLKPGLAAFLLVAGIAGFACAGERALTTAEDYRVMPGRIIKKIALPKGYHEGLFYDGSSIWVSNGKGLKTWVIDPLSGAILSELEPATGFTEAIARRSDGTLFMSDWIDKKLYEVRIDGGRIVAGQGFSFEPSHPAGVVWAGDRFFMITWTRGSLGTKFDIIEMDRDLNVKARIATGRIQEPSQLTWDGKHLWVSSWYANFIYKVDAGRWLIVGSVRSPVSRTTGITWDGRHLWVTGTAGDLYQMEV